MAKKQKLHFIGIAGHAMRGLALAAQGLGYRVQGTDENAYPPGSDWLDEQGLSWWRQPDAKHLEGVDQVIISGGTPPDYLELAEAKARGIEILSFAQLAGQLAADKHRIVIAGTHGKTTTTSMVAWILETAGRGPDFLVGIQPRNFENSVRLTDSEVIVLEGDEYQSSQLDPRPKFNWYKPDVLAITAIEMDHPDVFRNLEHIEGQFHKLAYGLPPQGRLYYWMGSAAAAKISKACSAPRAAYGLSQGDWKADQISYGPKGLDFTLIKRGQELGQVQVGLYGRHNVLNTIVASAICLDEGVPFGVVRSALSAFKGASRRFEFVTPPASDIMVIDDYAHHPTEVKATIEAVRSHFGGQRLIAVFRPHTYSRTRALLTEYYGAFSGADLAIVTDIEGAREEGQGAGVSGRDIVDGAVGNVEFIADRQQVIARVETEAKPGDIVLCMTVSGWDGLASELARIVSRKPVTV